MKYNRIIILSLALCLTATMSAQKRSTSRKKAKTTKVVKTQETNFNVPIDSLIGKAYTGKIGRTVVDFFGSRNTYGDVIHELYLWHDSIYALRQLNGSEESYSFGKYSYDGKTLTIGEFHYTPQKDGNALMLQKMNQNKEVREGIIPAVSPENIANILFVHGKYLDHMSIQEEEDKQNAFTCLSIAAENNVPGAYQYLYSYYKKKADNGDAKAIRYLYDEAMNMTDYTNACIYIEKLITIYPDNPELQCDKGNILLLQGNNSEAKKLWKKLRKSFADFVNTSSHPFCSKMR
ncbi:MAG: hypothetical protein KBT34_11190 [Prevotella sp.]|nr:hypothetical protein [Candidatus Prevotella equi]